MLPEKRRVYDEDSDIPRMLRWALVSIKEVGFPVAAFILIFYMCVVEIKANTQAITANTLILTEVRDAIYRTTK